MTTAVRDTGLPAPPAPAPGGAAPAGSSGSTGFMFSMFLACFAALMSAALARFSNLCIRPARTPSAVFSQFSSVLASASGVPQVSAPEAP